MKFTTAIPVSLFVLSGFTSVTALPVNIRVARSEEAVSDVASREPFGPLAGTLIRTLAPVAIDLIGRIFKRDEAAARDLDDAIAELLAARSESPADIAERDPISPGVAKAIWTFGPSLVAPAYDLIKNGVKKLFGRDINDDELEAIASAILQGRDFGSDLAEREPISPGVAKAIWKFGPSLVAPAYDLIKTGVKKLFGRDVNDDELEAIASAILQGRDFGSDLAEREPISPGVAKAIWTFGPSLVAPAYDLIKNGVKKLFGRDINDDELEAIASAILQGRDFTDNEKRILLLPGFKPYPNYRTLPFLKNVAARSADTPWVDFVRAVEDAVAQA
jgi:uncharacterized metal-binding protein